MRSGWRVIALLLGGFAGLCTLFAAAATAFDAWREYVHTQWPTAQAHISRCELRGYHQGRSWYIRCHVGFQVAGQPVAALLLSGNVPDPSRVITTTPGYPVLGDLQAWVDTHPPGTPIELHYKPADPQTIALVSTDMPLAGPHTASNLQVLEGFAVLSFVLLLLGSLGRRKP